MIEISKYYYNRDQHSELATEVNILAEKHGLQVSRWVNNSKGRQIITYKIHTGERNQFGSKQENVQFEITEDSGRGKYVTDETEMLWAVKNYLKTLATDESETTETPDATYINIDERYGDAYSVTLEDYIELNPDGDFTADEEGIYEDGEMIAQATEGID